jgi:Xaa-Pro aminopeptidase
MSPLRVERVERLLELAGNAGARSVLLTQPEHIFYLLGAEPPVEHHAALAVARDSIRLVWPGPPPSDLPHEIDTVAYSPDSAARGEDAEFDLVCCELFHPIGNHTLVVDAETARLSGVRATDGRHILEELLRCKDEGEVEVISRNLAGNDQAFAALGQSFSVGMVDYDVQALCVRELSEAAGRPVAYEGNIGLAEIGGDPEAQPAGAIAREGSLLFVDLYPRREHYVGDSTRSFAVGEPPAWAIEAHERLEAALQLGEAMLTPGALASDIDAACRAAAAGSDGITYPHHTGHGLGLRAPEPPYLITGGVDIIRAGDVVAIEPGVYIQDVGGMRLEDVFFVTETGPRRLNAFPRRLTVCG